MGSGLLSLVTKAIRAEDGPAQLSALVAAGHELRGCVDSGGHTVALMAARGGKLAVLQWLDSDGWNGSGRVTSIAAASSTAAAAAVTAVPDTASAPHAHLVCGPFHTDLSCNLKSALHLASEGGWTAAVEWLVGKGMNLEARDVEGKTPLHLAAAAGHRHVCSVLVRAGADPDATDLRENPTIHIAAAQEDVAMVRHLVGLGADVDGRSRRGYTALLLAASRQALPMVRLLGALGADVNACAGADTRCGWPALLTAAAKGHAHMVEALACMGARVDCTDDLGSPAIFLAAQNGHLRVVQSLALHGASLTTSVSGHTLFNFYALKVPDVLQWCRFVANHPLSAGGETTVAAAAAARAVLGVRAGSGNGRGLAFTQLHVAAALRRPDVIRTVLRSGRLSLSEVACAASPTPFELAETGCGGFPGAGAVDAETVAVLRLAAQPWSGRNHWLHGPAQRVLAHTVLLLATRLDRENAAASAAAIAAASADASASAEAYPHTHTHPHPPSGKLVLGHKELLPPELWHLICQLACMGPVTRQHSEPTRSRF
jgi:ankyrin repeat protein